MRAFRVEGDWWRGPARLVDDDELEYEDLDRVEGYGWAVAAELPYDLAAIRHPVDVLGFIRRWGFLRDDQAEDADLPSLREFMQEAVRMNWMLYLYALVRPGHSGPEVRKALGEYWAGIYTGLIAKDEKRWVTDPIRGRDLPPGLLEAVTEDADFEEMAIDVRETLEEELWDQVEHASLSIHSLDFFDPISGEEAPPGDFVLTALPRDLLARAYVELALEMTAGVSVSACPEDNRIFPIRDPRQVYCSPQCAGRARYRRFAERKRSKP